MLTSVAFVLLLGYLAAQSLEKWKLPGLIGMIFVGILIGPWGMGCLEMIGIVLLAPILFDVNRTEAFLIGSVLAAVSPAVVVPRMIRLMENGYGREKKIPQLILAGASVDDVFVLVVFSAVSGLLQGGDLDAASIAMVPLSIGIGALAGWGIGRLNGWAFSRMGQNHMEKVILLLGSSFLLLWVAEIFLFVLVGAAVNIKYAVLAGVSSIILVTGALCFRTVGVCLSLTKTNLNPKEKCFCAFSYLPKATVQAAIGSVPLSMGLSCGD